MLAASPKRTAAWTSEDGKLARRKRPEAKTNGQTAAEARDAGIDYGPLAEWIGFNLRIAQDASFQNFSHRSKEVGVRPGRFATLTLIGRNPGITQTALSRANSRDKSTLTPLLADLVRRGLIRRTRALNDQRTYRLSLTTAGAKLLDQLTACAREHERALDAVIGARERTQFLRILKRLAQQLG
jgi:DNA-binding MarR family transcriptional regulator